MNDEIKRLYRSRDDVMVAGVASGLANFLQLDPTLVRLVFVLTLFLGGTGALIYFVMWVVVPQEPLASESVVAPKPKAAAKKTPAKKTTTKKSAS